MLLVKELKKALGVALWFVFLTFPIMVVKVDPIERIIRYRWDNAVYVAIVTFLVYLLSSFFKMRKLRIAPDKKEVKKPRNIIYSILNNKKQMVILSFILLAVAVVFPQIFSTYQTNVMTTALMYVVLGLGLNIVVGMAGLLDLGFVAFYAVGAYSYALLNYHFGLGFWVVLPIGGGLAAIFGIVLGFPVLRLRGDYLAIVTLGFGEIIRLILENWGDFSQGPSGISNISRPSFFGMDFSLEASIVYMYYIMVLGVIVTIFIVNRLQDSRLGRA
jgi:branched-chain amino acid transport system permease protein